jgi:hypothetical protein
MYLLQGGFVDIRSNPVALVGIGAGALIMVIGLIVFIVMFVKRHRGSTQIHEYKPLETNDEP